jgi:heat shock protein HtpX
VATNCHEPPQPNAFALGSNTLVIDRSLIRLLPPAELEGVLAHELAHLEGYDSLLRTLATSLLRTVTVLLLLVAVPIIYRGGGRQNLSL